MVLWCVCKNMKLDECNLHSFFCVAVIKEKASLIIRKKIKGHKMCPFLAQAVRFELTCLYGKLISSQPRYDHFDTLAYLVRLGENPLDFPLDKVLKLNDKRR